MLAFLFVSVVVRYCSNTVLSPGERSSSATSCDSRFRVGRANTLMARCQHFHLSQIRA